ncbi:MAG: hydrogenase subunit MbhD domain-containing protein [Angelakisella sp.]
MLIFDKLLLGLLVVCAIAASLTKRTLTAVVIYMSYSLVMAVLWVLLESPDLSITEAAVGAGITGILFFTTLKRVDELGGDNNGDKK